MPFCWFVQASVFDPFGFSLNNAGTFILPQSVGALVMYLWIDHTVMSEALPMKSIQCASFIFSISLAYSFQARLKSAWTWCPVLKCLLWAFAPKLLSACHAVAHSSDHHHLVFGHCLVIGTCLVTVSSMVWHGVTIRPTHIPFPKLSGL